MKKERLVQCYGLYGVSAELAEVCKPADLKPVKKAERAFALAIAEAHVEGRMHRWGEPADYPRPVAMKVRVGDIMRSTFLDCYRSTAERAHRERGAIISFPDEADAHWRSFSWYGKKWCGNTRRDFDFAASDIMKEAKRAMEGKREPLIKAEERLLQASLVWKAELETLERVLRYRVASARNAEEEEEAIYSRPHPEAQIEYAMQIGRKDVAGEILYELDDVEDRVYFADKHDLPLADCDEAWARAEHDAYVAGIRY